MELDKSAGIVLRITPHKSTVTIFDRAHGVIEITADRTLPVKRLCNGAFIVYVIQHRHTRYTLSNVDFVHVPFKWARYDILFLHHILELVFYFIPPRNPHDNIFQLLRSLYVSPCRNTAMFKRIFLIHLFLLFGMYPEDEQLFKQMHKIIEKPVDDFVEEGLHLEIEQIDAWLRSCMRLHPYNELFKTSHFLARTR